MKKPSEKLLKSGITGYFWSREQLFGAWQECGDLKMIANGCRLNALTSIQEAGSGHIGSSLSVMDILVAVRYYLQSSSFPGPLPPDHQRFFSSKGHDAPALYATMHLSGEVPDQGLFTLRRLGGLPGHPETITPGVPTNTGSLGMGISKAKGFVKARRLRQPSSRDPVVVILGDGELGEGQIWESLPGAARDGFSELVAIVDANGLQSDTWVQQTLPLGDVRKRVEGAGWSFLECDGNSPQAVFDSLREAEKFDSPTMIYASTRKGAGVHWMEDFPQDGHFYKFHSGALDPGVYEKAAQALSAQFAPNPKPVTSGLLEGRPERDAYSPRARASSLLTIWEQKIRLLMAEEQTAVALDGDLSYDTGTHLVRNDFPDRYVQAGIAEQDMVSMAGTLALSGYLPLVHSFATFLTMRATEQIFNNSTEYSRIIYLGFLAGLVPSAPGFSHQAVTDVGIMASIPGMRIFEPSCASELDWAISEARVHSGPSYIRMGGLSPLEESQEDSPSPNLRLRSPGEHIAIISSGPLLSGEGEAALRLADAEGLSVALYTRPEINRPLEPEEIAELEGFTLVVVLENHNPALAKFHYCSNALYSLGTVRVVRIGLDGIPANGQAQEVMESHQLDAKAMLHTVVSRLNNAD